MQNREEPKKSHCNIRTRSRISRQSFAVYQPLVTLLIDAESDFNIRSSRCIIKVDLMATKTLKAEASNKHADRDNRGLRQNVGKRVQFAPKNHGGRDFTPASFFT